MKNELYIVFAEKIGEDNDEKYFYRLLFSDNPDIVWGNNFGETPAGIIPDIEPDSMTIKKEYLMTSNIKICTAVESTWFSMQDCIDGIISLLFAVNNNIIVNIPFGLSYDEVLEKISEFGTIEEVEYKPKNISENGEES